MITELTFSSFARELQMALQPPNGDKDVVLLLLDWITQKERVVDKKGNPVNLTPSLISTLMNQAVDVPKAIKDACTEIAILNEAVRHVDQKVMPCLNPFMETDMYANIAAMINNDEGISNEKKQKLILLYEQKQYSQFLAQVLLYVIHKPNRLDGQALEISDIPLLAEAGYHCPKCSCDLVKSIKGMSMKNYCMVHIYPEITPAEGVGFESAIVPMKPNDHHNLIALCPDCAKQYLVAPTFSEYEELMTRKEEMEKYISKTRILSSLSLEDEIRDVIYALADIDTSDIEELSLDALRIDQKLMPENVLLIDEMRTWVLRYYRFIEKVFAGMERNDICDFDTIASEMKIAFKKCNDTLMTQGEIVDMLAQWIQQKTRVSNLNAQACRVVVAYFVQNCEVFREIAK